MVVLFSVNVTELPANFASLNCRHISSFSFMLGIPFPLILNPLVPVQLSTVGPWVRAHSTQANSSAKLYDFFIAHPSSLALSGPKKPCSPASQRDGPCFIP